MIPLHSTVSLSEQQMAFRAPDKGKRKVILATNIAESSITVPDIRYGETTLRGEVPLINNN